MSELITRQYRKILHLRREGLHKYNSLFPHEFTKVPAVYSRPHVVLEKDKRSLIHAIGLRHHDVGSRMCIVDRPVPWVIARRLVKDEDGILDVGCSDGMFFRFLRFNGIRARYSGVDVDESFGADFPLCRSIKEVHGTFQVVTIFHTIEHMVVDDFLAVLKRLNSLLAGRELLIVATPNVLSPGVFERDIEHIQPYPWYDLYAILRLFFREVEVRRGHYLCTPLRLASVPVKVFLGQLLERDWCEEVILVARGLTRLDQNDQ